MNGEVNNEQLIFVYNAEKDIVSSVIGYAHKVFSPSTYSCELCMLTHHHLGERQQWKVFKDNVKIDLQFIYQKEFKERFKLDVELPVVVHTSSESDIKIVMDKVELKQLKSVDDLISKLEQFLM